MRFGWVGCHAEGRPALEALLDAGAPIAGIVTLQPERAELDQLDAHILYTGRRHALPLGAKAEPIRSRRRRASTGSRAR